MKSKGLHILKKTLLWTVGCIVALVLLIPALLYIPFIQDFAKEIAVREIEKSTGMDVELDRLRLHFPLTVELQGLMMAQEGDTMISARQAEVDVAFWPLLKKHIKVDEARLADASYRLNTPDSAIYLKARIDRFSTEGTDLTLNMQNIFIGRTILDGADVYLAIKDTVTQPSPSDTASNAMTITAPDLVLHNVNVHMRMLPTIDSLYARIGSAHLADGRIDMLAKTITAGSLDIDSLTAAYLTPSEEFLSTYKSPSSADSISAIADNEVSEPWSISIGRIDISAPSALYARSGLKPLPGLDPEYIQVSDTKIRIDSFFNRGSEINVPLRQFSLKERSGLTLNATGTFSMDSAAMHAGNFHLETQNSGLGINATMGLGNLAENPSLPLSLQAKGKIAVADVITAFPAIGAMLKGMPSGTALDINADINGTSGQLDINRLNASMKGVMSLKASGHVINPMDFNRMNGQVKIDGQIADVDFLKDKILDKATAKSIGIPPMTIKGLVNYRPGLIDGDVDVRSSGGRLALDARWNQKAEGYDLKMSTSRFPVERFMPGLGVSDLSADVNLKGHGYDPSRRSTSMLADVRLHHLSYQGQSLDNIALNASLDTCRLTGHIVSSNPAADMDADLTAWISRDGYEWDLSGDIRHLDLEALKLTDSPMNGTVELYSGGRYNPQNGDIDADLNLSRLNWMMGDDQITMADATAKLFSTDSLTQASVTSDDLNLKARALCGLDSLLARFDRTSKLLTTQISDKSIDVEALQNALPQLHLALTSGNNNVVARYLSETSGIDFSSGRLTFSNDSLISMQAGVNGFRSGSTRLDSITFDANQHNRFLVYKLAVDNRPGTMDDFAHVYLNGFISADKLSAMLKQSNIQGKQGFLIGLTTTMTDSTITAKFVPYSPTIAYKKWKINQDNIVIYDFKHKHLDANLKLQSDSSSLHLYTDHLSDTLALGQEDVVLDMKNINLAEWLSISPFAPPIKGDIDAALRFRWDEQQITGKGLVNVNDLYYGRERVGTFDIDLNVANDSHTGALRADASLMIDKVKVITASGNLNDSTAVHPFLLDFSMIHFPLRVVNPFLPKGVARLSGMLNGTMDITGDLANPIFNGYLDFDSTAVKVGITGATYRFSEDKIPVDSNIVKFSNFTIDGLNNNPLRINGVVDARHISDIRLDLSAVARDMQIVKSSRPKGANVYGKAFIDLDAKVKGNMSLLRVDANLNLLAGTNVTYVMTDAVQSLSPQGSGDMVRFVQFSDTTQILDADSIPDTSMALLLNADLTISEGSTINVDLSPDGKNKVSISGNGNFTYSMTPMNTDGRITGRYTISSGFVRYTPQISTGGLSMAIMSEKNFKFQEGSYIAFTGDMLNPTLNIRAVDELKANVTQSGQNSRLVNFDVMLSITNTLKNMNVAFDLSTNDDLTIQNELQGMSPEQRANQAMNMLLYNQYTGPGTKANANLSGNPLYSFLASQLNSWAANNIRGVDISFGIDQYDKTTDGSKSTTTSYSYRVSKTLFNDRFKIVVGGNYSTDADADENFSQNLINDISFEYMLNRSGSMYVRLFRHVGYESILEGEITQTGVGFVLKRKLNSLRDIFRFARKPQSAAVPAPAATETEPQQKATEK